MVQRTQQTWQQLEKKVSAATKRLEARGRALGKRLENEGKLIAKRAKTELNSADTWRKDLDGKVEELGRQLIASVGLATRSDIAKLSKKLSTLAKRFDALDHRAN